MIRVLNNDQFYFNDKVHYVKQNVGNYQFTRTFYDSVDYVFHLAAESRLQPAIENPISSQETVLEQQLRCNVPGKQE